MRVLGLHCGHDSSLAIAENGKIIFAVEEERLTGIKKMCGFPARSLIYACNRIGVGIRDFDKVVYSQKGNFFFRPTHVIYGDPENLYPDAEFIDHHYAHALSAYCLSGFDDCMVLTLDGGGDDKFATIYEAKNGKLTLIAENRFVEYPFGIFYNHVTELCGFKPNRHEGKIMGLAAHGNKRDIFNDMFWVEGTQIRSIGKKTGLNVEPIVLKRLQKESPKEKPLTIIDIACSAQATFENIVTKWVETNIPKDRDLAVAGGCFANVLANMKIAKLVKRLFVAPPMFDDGLSIGAALSAFDPLPCARPDDMYYGFYSLPKESNRYSAKSVADMLVAGKIVGLMQGKMEFGPRALGNRSILADPRSFSINKLLNERLSRSEFMPFAPVILEEYADEILEDYQLGIDNAPFMTSCWQVKDEWKLKIPAVVHKDGTARPQVIKRSTNPYYYDIVDEFRKITDIPVLINTSFNVHEDPILCFREEAEWAAATGRIDVLVEA